MMIKTIITKITTNNYQNIGNKTARHFSNVNPK